VLKIRKDSLEWYSVFLTESLSFSSRRMISAQRTLLVLLPDPVKRNAPAFDEAEAQVVS
jgi:hypothetical protein